MTLAGAEAEVPWSCVAFPEVQAPVTASSFTTPAELLAAARPIFFCQILLTGHLPNTYNFGFEARCPMRNPFCITPMIFQNMRFRRKILLWQMISLIEPTKNCILWSTEDDFPECSCGCYISWLDGFFQFGIFSIKMMNSSTAQPERWQRLALMHSYKEISLFRIYIKCSEFCGIAWYFMVLT